MTNTEHMTINHETSSPEGMRTMNGYVEFTQLVVRDRIRAREVEAASERLAAVARTTSTNGNARRRVGRLLILAGRRIAGESVTSGSPAARSARPAEPVAA